MRFKTISCFGASLSFSLSIKRKPLCKINSATRLFFFFGGTLANCFTLQGNSLHWKLLSPGLTWGSFLSGSLTKKITQGSGNHSPWTSYDVPFLSAHVTVTRGDWCDVACFFFCLSFFSFPFYWLVGALSLKALQSRVPKGIYDSRIYDSRQGQLKPELLWTQHS